MEEEINKQIKKERFELTEVPTETAVVVKDNVSGKVMDMHTVQLMILNELNDIKKAVI